MSDYHTIPADQISQEEYDAIEKHEKEEEEKHSDLKECPICKYYETKTCEHDEQAILDWKQDNKE